MANIATQSGSEEMVELKERFRSFQSAHVRLDGRLEFMTREFANHKYPKDAIRSSSKAIQVMVAEMESISAKWENDSQLALHLENCNGALYAIFSNITNIEKKTPEPGIAAELLTNAREEFEKMIYTVEIMKKIIESDEFIQSDNGLKIAEKTSAVIIPSPIQEDQDIALPMEPGLQNKKPESIVLRNKCENDDSKNAPKNADGEEKQQDRKLIVEDVSDDKSKKNGKRNAEVSGSEPEAKRVDRQLEERSGVAPTTEDQEEPAIIVNGVNPIETESNSEGLNVVPPASNVQNLVDGTEESKEDRMENQNAESGNGSEMRDKSQEVRDKTPLAVLPLPNHQVPVDLLLHPQNSNSGESYDLANVDGNVQCSKMNTTNATVVVPTASHVPKNQNLDKGEEEPMEVEEQTTRETHGSSEEPMELTDEVPPTAQTVRSPVVAPSTELKNDSEHPVVSTPGPLGPSFNPLNHDVVAEEDEDVQHKSNNTAPGCSNQAVKSSDEKDDVQSVSVISETTKRNIIWQDPAGKEIELNFRTAKGIYFHSRKFFAEAHLFSVLIRKGSVTSRAEIRSYFESIKKRFKESNCFEVELPIGYDLAGNKNYRGLKPIYVGHILVKVSTSLPNLPDNYLLYPPPIQFTGPVHIDAFNVTGAQIIEAASQMYLDKKEERKTFLGSPSDLKVFPGGDINTVGNERKDFVAIGNQSKEECQKAEEANYFPVVSYPGSILHNPDVLEEACKTHHFFKVKEAWKELNLNTALFEIDMLTAKDPKSEISLIRQIPQEICFNFPFNQTKGWKNEKQAKGWESKGLKQINVSFEQFADLFNKLNDLAETAYDQLENRTENVEKVMADLDEELKKVSDSVKVTEKDAVHQVSVLLFFGSNIDLSEESFPEQSEEIQSKFPDCWAPRGKGDLLKLTGTIPGMTHAQAYAKTPGSRTNAHQENNSVGSINVNKGPASSYWCVVPPEYNDKFQRLIIKKLSARKNFCKTGYFPNLEDCIAEGIPVQMCEQKAGDGIFVGPATYHWVQCNGFATNISWNVCRPTACQLAAAMIHHDHVMQNDGLSLVSLQDILFHLPNANIEMDMEMLQVVKISLMRLLIACTQELEFVKTKRPEWTIVTASSDLNEVERCSICKRVLFNLVPKTLVARENKAYCFKCLDHSRFPKSSQGRAVTIYQRYDLTLIAEKFDMVKVDAPIF